MDNQQGSVPAGNPDGAAATGQQAPWYQSFPDEVRGLVETKGWQTPVDAITSYANLEKFLGADKAGRGLVLPKDDNPDEWGQVYDRLGRPKAPDGYKLPVPDGDTGEFAKAAADIFHKAGLTTKQAEALAGWWNQTQQQMNGSQQESLVQRSEQEMAQLQQEWGKDFDANIEAGRRAARQFGVDADTISAMESSIGTRKVMELFTKIGKGLTEDTFVDGAGNRGFGVSPEAARVRIGQLKADPGWTAKYLGGDADAKAEMERLLRAAYPE